MQQLIRSEPLAALVTLGSSGLFASHIPMALEEAGSEFGVLRAHVSRANPQWQDFNPNVEALAIFSGPQHYITPSWYPSKAEDAKVVPTWNYVVVHAYGTLRAIDDEDWLLAHLEKLTRQHESSAPVPWQVSDAPTDFIRTQMRGIVGLELPIRRLEGKWKVSQNRSSRDRQSISQGLAALNTPAALAMKALVED